MSYYSAPVDLLSVGQGGGLSAPYSLAALSGKTMFDRNGNTTELTTPMSLGTAIDKTFVSPPNIKVIVFKHDYMLVTYQFTDGKDLDTATRIDSPNVSNYVGYGLGAVTLNSALSWGGDNTGIGFESVLIDMTNLRKDPSIESITILCKANWFGSRGNNPVNLGVTLWKGGIPVQRGFGWENPNANNELITESYEKIVTSSTKSPASSGTTIGTITYNLKSGVVTINISP